MQNPSTDSRPATAVQASLAVGNLQGGTDVVAGSLGEASQAMNAVNGAILPGFPWFQADSDFTTPALADLYGNGQTDIIEGGDSTAGFAYGQTLQQRRSPPRDRAHRQRLHREPGRRSRL